LQRLHALTGNDEYRLRHDELLISFAGEAGRYGPVFAGTYYLAAELWIHPPPEIVILGPRTAPEVRSLQLAAAESFAPGKTVLIVDKEDDKHGLPRREALRRSKLERPEDRKSTRLNSSHVASSYA